eukprot:TRINITY_DN2872_c0_g2_i2.p1 TRINITY_DN2872_c0_g2~~TRINITY_DN2872_c0_g2_i2.p1  ORF type:complete len:638 (+),score=160.27 TRINITY_DN2872_c0_g2_i2:972-2885(+)
MFSNSSSMQLSLVDDGGGEDSDSSDDENESDTDSSVIEESFPGSSIDINTFQTTDDRDGLIWKQREDIQREDLLWKLKSKIFEKRRDILKEFRKEDMEGKGTVTRLQWAKVMGKVFDLDVPWLVLSRWFVSLDSNKKVNYHSFLEKYEIKLNRATIHQWESSLAELICTQIHLKSGNLEQAFRELDVDQTGQLSYAQMTNALSHFDLCLTKQQIADYVRYLDQDGDGLIHLQEFQQRFQITFEKISELRKKKADSGHKSSASISYKQQQLEQFLLSDKEGHWEKDTLQEVCGDIFGKKVLLANYFKSIVERRKEREWEKVEAKGGPAAADEMEVIESELFPLEGKISKKAFVKGMRKFCLGKLTEPQLQILADILVGQEKRRKKKYQGRWKASLKEGIQEEDREQHKSTSHLKASEGGQNEAKNILSEPEEKAKSTDSHGGGESKFQCADNDGTTGDANVEQKTKTEKEEEEEEEVKEPKQKEISSPVKSSRSRRTSANSRSKSKSEETEVSSSHKKSTPDKDPGDREKEKEKERPRTRTEDDEGFKGRGKRVSSAEGETETKKLKSDPSDQDHHSQADRPPFGMTLYDMQREILRPVTDDSSMTIQIRKLRVDLCSLFGNHPKNDDCNGMLTSLLW